MTSRTATRPPIHTLNHGNKEIDTMNSDARGHDENDKFLDFFLGWDPRLGKDFRVSYFISMLRWCANLQKGNKPYVPSGMYKIIYPYDGRLNNTHSGVKAMNELIQSAINGTPHKKLIPESEGLIKSGKAEHLTVNATAQIIEYVKIGNVHLGNLPDTMKKDSYLYEEWVLFFCELFNRLTEHHEDYPDDEHKRVGKNLDSDALIFIRELYSKISPYNMPEYNFAVAVVQTFLKDLYMVNGKDTVDILHRPSEWANAKGGSYKDKFDLIIDIFPPLEAQSFTESYLNVSEAIVTSEGGSRETITPTHDETTHDDDWEDEEEDDASSVKSEEYLDDVSEAIPPIRKSAKFSAVLKDSDKPHKSAASTKLTTPTKLTTSSKIMKKKTTTASPTSSTSPTSPARGAPAGPSKVSRMYKKYHNMQGGMFGVGSKSKDNGSLVITQETLDFINGQFTPQIVNEATTLMMAPGEYLVAKSNSLPNKEAYLKALRGGDEETRSRYLKYPSLQSYKLVTKVNSTYNETNYYDLVNQIQLGTIGDIPHVFQTSGSASSLPTTSVSAATGSIASMTPATTLTLPMPSLLTATDLTVLPPSKAGDPVAPATGDPAAPATGDSADPAVLTIPAEASSNILKTLFNAFKRAGIGMKRAGKRVRHHVFDKPVSNAAARALMTDTGAKFMATRVAVDSEIAFGESMFKPTSFNPDAVIVLKDGALVPISDYKPVDGEKIKDMETLLAERLSTVSGSAVRARALIDTPTRISNPYKVIHRKTDAFIMFDKLTSDDCLYDKKQAPRVFTTRHLERFLRKRVEKIMREAEDSAEKQLKDISDEIQGGDDMQDELLDTVDKHTQSRQSKKYTYFRDKDGVLFVTNTYINKTVRAADSASQSAHVCKNSGVAAILGDKEDATNCAEFFNFCIDGKDSTGCHNFLTKPSFWTKDIDQFIKNANLYIASKALLKFGITIDSTNGINTFISVDKWLKSLSNNFQLKRNIEQNEPLIELLKRVIEEINNTSIILNRDAVIVPNDTKSELTHLGTYIARRRKINPPNSSSLPDVYSQVSDKYTSDLKIEGNDVLNELENLVKIAKNTVQKKVSFATHNTLNGDKVKMNSKYFQIGGNKNFDITTHEAYTVLQSLIDRIKNMDTGVSIKFKNVLEGDLKALQVKGRKLSNNHTNLLQKSINYMNRSELVYLKIAYAVQSFLVFFHSEITSFILNLQSGNPSDDDYLKRVVNRVDITIDEIFKMIKIARAKLTKYCASNGTVNKMGKICDELSLNLLTFDMATEQKKISLN